MGRDKVRNPGARMTDLSEGDPPGGRILDALAHQLQVKRAPGVPAEYLELMRTEDCRLSGDGKVLAIAGFADSAIILFNLEHRRDADGVSVTLTGMLRLRNGALDEPHGLDFIDARSIAVANRGGNVAVLGIPARAFDGAEIVAPLELEIDRVDGSVEMHSPGSVAVMHRPFGRYALLSCLNYRHRVVRHDVWRLHRRHRLRRGRQVLAAGLDIPDGISVCRGTGRLAISNHAEHAVRLYPSWRALDPQDEPCGRLLGVSYPHGVRFFDAGRGILVADAGAPLVHYYRDPSAAWTGTRAPTASFRIMESETFLRGRHNIEEGGPKGLEIHPAGDVFFVTSEFQTLAAFDLRALLDAAHA